MILKGLIEEDFCNYKKPTMTLMFPYCSFKCDNEAGIKICQNSELTLSPNIEIGYYDLLKRYEKNPITKGVVCSGLEPFDSKELYDFINYFRKFNSDVIVIYTGYTEQEVKEKFSWIFLPYYKNIIIKFGRFIPNDEFHYDEILGVQLASSNQYAKRIS